MNGHRDALLGKQVMNLINEKANLWSQIVSKQYSFMRHGDIAKRIAVVSSWMWVFCEY